MKARIPQGMGGGASGNMNQLMQQAQKMQSKMAEVQQELDVREHTVTSGGSMVEFTLNGTYEATALKINPEAVDKDDLELLEDLVMAAFNEGVRVVKEVCETELAKVTGGIM